MKHKILPWVVIGFLLLFITSNPSGAANTAHGIGASLAGVAGGVGDFITALVGGGGR